MKARLLKLALAAIAVSMSAACGGSLNRTKTDCGQGALGTIADTGALFSLNGGPPSGPSGVNTCGPAPARTVPGVRFDFAVTVNDTQAFVLPPLLVSGARTAGWLQSAQPYDAISDAPTFGYNDSMPLLISAGTVFLIQSLQVNCAVLPAQSQRYIYSKFVVDSIHSYPFDAVTAPAGLTVYYRMRNDPFCGYTSLAPGDPTH